MGAESPLIFGAVFGAMLVCAGLVLGAAMSRRSQSSGSSTGERPEQRSTSAADDDPALLNLLAELTQAKEELHDRIGKAESTLQEQATELNAYMCEARTDTLTGLPNRRVFDEELRQRISEWKSAGVPVGVVIVDVDHFKAFNDQFGHPAGDEVLCGVASVLRSAMREEDVVARLGGEEFAAVVSAADATEVREAAERVRQAIASATFRYDDQTLSVTVSCGAGLARAGEPGSELIKRADVALYAAKTGGRNAAYWHDGHTCSRITESRSPLPDVRFGVSPVASRDFREVCDDLRRRMLEVVERDA